MIDACTKPQLSSKCSSSMGQGLLQEFSTPEQKPYYKNTGILRLNKNKVAIHR